MGIPHSSDIN